MSKYEILLGTKLDASGIKDDINKLNDKHKIKLGVDLKVNDIKDRIKQYNTNSNNIKVKLGVKLDTDDIKKQISKIGDLNIGNGKGVAIPISTESLEQSLKEVKEIVESVRKSFGSIDDESGLKSLLSSVNQIANALDKATDESNGLIKSLNELSKKDFNFNFNLKAGNSNPVQTMTKYGQAVSREAIPALKEQINYLKDTISRTKDADKALEQYLVKKHKGFDGLTVKRNLEKQMTTGSDLEGVKISKNQQMLVHEEYLNYLKEVAALNGIDLSGFNSKFSKSAAEIIDDVTKIQSGAKETEEQVEKLKTIFNTGIDTDGLSNALDPIVQDLKNIGEFIGRLDDNNSIDSLTASFNKLSETLEQLMTNAKLVQDVLGNVSGVGTTGTGGNIIDTNRIEKESDDVTNTVVQNQKKQQQAYRQTGKLISDSAQKAINSVSSDGINKYFKVNESDSDGFRSEMDSLVRQWTNGKGNLVDLKIDTRTSYSEEEGKNVERLHQAQVTYNNELGETVKKTIAWRQIGTTINDEGKKVPLRGFVEVAGQYSKSLGQTQIQTNKFVQNQKKAVSDLTNQTKQLHSSTIDQNASRPIKDQSHLDALKSKYKEIENAIEKMGNASSEAFAEEQIKVKDLISEYKVMKAEYKNAENVSSKLKGTDFKSGLEIAKNDLEKFKAEAKDFPQITQTIKELDKAIENVGDKSSLDDFTNDLKVARSELSKVKTETTAINRDEKVGIKASGLESDIKNLQRISPEIDSFEAEINGAKVTIQSLFDSLKQVKTQSDFSVVKENFRAFRKEAQSAGIAVTETVKKVKSIDDIKLDIELGTYANEMSQMHDRFNKLSIVNEKLCDSVEETKIAYKEMIDIATRDDDGIIDAERLADAQKKYAESIEKTNNLLKIQARIEADDIRSERLEQSKTSLSLDMQNWLKENSRAANDFGDKIRRLISLLDELDDERAVANVGRQFKNITKEAKLMGKTGLTLFDQIKQKTKEYSAYFSVAEIFMYAEQALREMFNTVVEIDTAMTGLYRVTDLTAAQYSSLYDGMIESAKEYGATLTDIINATTDWVRAGFDADKAVGLAEVTTMYQHISDLDYDTAAENLITAYNGFKNELNSLYDGDEVAAVQYIADIFNELDRYNCP